MVDASAPVSAGPNVSTASNFASGPKKDEEDVAKSREQIRALRDAIVSRTKLRHTEHTDAHVELRAFPDQFPEPYESGLQWEMSVVRILITALLDTSTTLPVSVEAFHQRLLCGPRGEEYARCLGSMGYSKGPHPIIAKMCRDGLLEALYMHVGPQTGGAPKRMYITMLDRQRLAGLAGVDDPGAFAALLQQTQQMQAMMNMQQQQQGMGPQGPVPMMPGILQGVNQQGGLPGTMPGIPGPPGGPMPPPGIPGPPGGPPQQPQGPQGFMQGGMPNIMMGGSMSIDVMPPILPGGGPGGLDMKGPTAGGMQGMGVQQQQQQDGGAGKRPAENDLDSLLSRKTLRDRMHVDRGGVAELQAVLTKPTAREAAQLEAFRTVGGQSAIQEHCPHLTKEECRRANNKPAACPRLHFRRLIYPHTDPSLGNCSYLNTCRNFRNCRYIHYEVDDDPDLSMMNNNAMMGQQGMMMPGMTPPGSGGAPGNMMLMAQGGGGGPGTSGSNKSIPFVPKYLQALAEPQWIRCDVRKFDMKVLGKFGVIMADPPWQIHQELPYGTMDDEEMRKMDIGCLQDDGVIFLWVTGRAMELGRECLKIWGYDRVDELIWVKTNQLNRLIRTGRTGHWLNHSKEHCLIGVKGKPNLNKYVDCDVVVAEVRETSRKPDEMYTLLERLSPNTRKLEIFARQHNLTKGWVGLGNQLPGVKVVDPDMRERYIARYGGPGPNGELPVPDAS